MLTDDDPDFTKLFRRILADRRAGLDSVIEAGKADGSFRADLDGSALVDAIVGAHVYERARTGRVASGSETRLFDLFWPVERRPRCT
jgi:Tetracyclin repressor-like, C-terminal domain